MPEIARFQVLRCACGSQEFYQTFRLLRHPGAGPSQEPVGQRCAVCHHPADTAQMMKAIQMEHRRRELTQLEEEIAESS